MQQGFQPDFLIHSQNICTRFSRLILCAVVHPKTFPLNSQNTLNYFWNSYLETIGPKQDLFLINTLLEKQVSNHFNFTMRKNLPKTTDILSIPHRRLKVAILKFSLMYLINNVHAAASGIQLPIPLKPATSSKLDSGSSNMYIIDKYIRKNFKIAVYVFQFLSIFSNMKPLSVEMACLLGIQDEIQAVCTPRAKWRACQRLSQPDQFFHKSESAKNLPLWLKANYGCQVGKGMNICSFFHLGRLLES